MEPSSLLARVKTRFLPGEALPDDEAIAEMVQTVRDRLMIRMDADSLPEVAASIVVDASVKALRLRGYEGSTSESASEGGSVSNSFIDDVLSAYSEDIAALKKAAHRNGIKFFR